MRGWSRRLARWVATRRPRRSRLPARWRPSISTGSTRPDSSKAAIAASAAGSAGAGRPARVCWRAADEFSVSFPERRYDRVAHLFASALERLGGQALPAPLQHAARELGEQLGTAERKGGPTTRLTAALKAGGYEPDTDAMGVVRLRNCPFRALAAEHRWLVCGTNLAIAEGMVHGSGVTALRPLPDLQPGHCCVAFVPEAPAP